MDEILKKLLESDLLSEETKAEITAKFKSTVETFLAEERSKLEVEVRSTLTEEFVKAREELVEALDTKLNDIVEKEYTELKDDINKFRDLEVEYAEKLVEEKEVLAQQLGEQLNQLVEKLDAFLEVRLDEEIAELKEDIDAVKRLEFGRKIFEAVEAEYKKFRKADLTEVEQKLSVAEDELSDAKSKIAEMEGSRLSEARSTKLEELLQPLTGTSREQMKIILSNVATEKLDEAYKVYIGRILKENIVDKKDDKKALVEDKKVVVETKLVTGNENQEVEDNKDVTQPNDQLLRIRKLAGLATR